MCCTVSYPGRGRIGFPVSGPVWRARKKETSSRVAIRPSSSWRGPSSSVVVGRVVRGKRRRAAARFFSCFSFLHANEFSHATHTVIIFPPPRLTRSSTRDSRRRAGSDRPRPGEYAKRQAGGAATTFHVTVLVHVERGSSDASLATASPSLPSRAVRSHVSPTIDKSRGRI